VGVQSRRLEEVRREEQELLEAQSVPLRNYLMKHIMPTLTRGLRDCVSVRPDDPIDFLVSALPSTKLCVTQISKLTICV